MNWDEYTKDVTTAFKDIAMYISSEEWKKTLNYLPMITYVVYSWLLWLLCHKKCDECKERLTSNVGNVETIENKLISEIPRSGLLYPCSDIIQMVIVNGCRQVIRNG